MRAWSFDYIKGNFLNKIIRRIAPGTRPPQLCSLPLCYQSYHLRNYTYLNRSSKMSYSGSLVCTYCVLVFPPPQTHIAHPITHTPNPPRPPGSTKTQSYKYYSNEQLWYGNSNLCFQNFRRHCVIKSLVLNLLCFSLSQLVLHLMWLVLHVLWPTTLNKILSFIFLSDWNAVWTPHITLTRAVASLARAVRNTLSKCCGAFSQRVS